MLKLNCQTAATSGWTLRGIVLNPRRKDLLDTLKNTRLPLKSIQELKDEAEKICGIPEKLNLGEEIVAIIKWVDDTVIDAIRRVIPG